MRPGFLALPPGERRLYVEQAAVRLGRSAVVVEKDFWVCWLLALLFGSPFAPALVFKGGTSLAKVFGVIDRFSEDIDLSLAPAFLGLPAAGADRTQADRWMTRAEAACGRAVETRVAPAVETAAALGPRTGGWFEFQTDARTPSPVHLFHYPSAQPGGFDYLARAVTLEFGSLTDQRPTGRHPVRPWLADALPAALPDWRCEVVALEGERTFWEKATILHAEYHRPPGKATPDRFSRHYADTAALARHPLAARALARPDLRDRVAAWKAQFFGSAWARYDLAVPGSFRLVPPAHRLGELRRDYRAMRDMYPTEPPPFDDVLATLAALERELNRPAA